MKTKLLSFVFLFTFFYSNAQMFQIEVVGKGIKGQTTETLTFTGDLSNIDHIDVGVIKSWGPSITASDVTFSNFNGNVTTTLHSDVINKSSFPSAPGEYLTASFSDIDATGIDVMITNDGNNFKDYMQSFYAFVYRDILNATYKSFASLETAYFYQNGSSDPYIYNIPIDAASGVRDITVKIPISELEADSRPVIIDIAAGIKTEHAEVTTYTSLGNSLYIGEYTLTDVPEDVTNVTVSIYSPSVSAGEVRGDSFYVNGVVVDVEIVEEGCTLTQGYWKNHADPSKKKYDDTWDELGPDGAKTTPFFLSEQRYIDVLNTNPNKEGKYYILAHQYIAAELNMYAGASVPTEVQIAFNDATDFFNKYEPSEVNKNYPDREAQCVDLGKILDDYNNGRIGPGHCDEETTEAEKQSIEKEISIYPNPASTYGKIEFTPKQNADTTVKLYNIIGQEVGVLYNKKTNMGIPVSIEYSTEQFKRGMYFAIIKNGSNVYKEKISILK